MSEYTNRREYADQVAARREIEHDIAKQNGTLMPTSAKVKRGLIAFLFGLFLGDMLR